MRLLLGHILKTVVPADVVTLSGHSNSAFNFGADAIAQFKLDNDGNMYERDNGGAWSQIDTTDDWIRPASSAGSPYRGRYTNHTGDPLDGNTSQSEDTWQSTATDFIFSITDTTPLAATKTGNFDIEVDDGTTQQDIEAYTLHADREDF